MDTTKDEMKVNIQVNIERKTFKRDNFLLNLDFQKTKLWLLLQSFMMITRGSLVLGGMCLL